MFTKFHIFVICNVSFFSITVDVPYRIEEKQLHVCEEIPYHHRTHAECFRQETLPTIRRRLLEVGYSFIFVNFW